MMERRDRDIRYSHIGYFVDAKSDDGRLQKLQEAYTSGRALSSMVQFQVWALDVMRLGQDGHSRAWGLSMLEQCNLFLTVRNAVDRALEIDASWEEVCVWPVSACAHGVVPIACASMTPSLVATVARVISLWGLNPERTPPNEEQVQDLMTVVLQVCKCTTCFADILTYCCQKQFYWGWHHHSKDFEMYNRIMAIAPVLPTVVRILGEWAMHTAACDLVLFLVQVHAHRFKCGSQFRNYFNPTAAIEKLRVIDRVLVALCDHVSYSVIEAVLAWDSFEFYSEDIEGAQSARPRFVFVFRSRKATLDGRWSGARAAWCSAVVSIHSRK